MSKHFSARYRFVERDWRNISITLIDISNTLLDAGPVLYLAAKRG